MAGVLLCKRDMFLERAEFMQLVYGAVAPSRPGLKDAAAVALPVPTILKPRPLWTGKQVLHSTRPSRPPLQHLSLRADRQSSGMLLEEGEVRL